MSANASGPGPAAAAKAARYIRGGSAASSRGRPWRTSTTARKDPASSLSSPAKIQPGPHPSSAAHQPIDRPRRSGKKRRKSTCSPTWTISAIVTEAAAPNEVKAKPPLPLSMPPKPRHAARSCGLRSTMAAMGTMFRQRKMGCVHAWNRLIAEMP